MNAIETKNLTKCFGTVTAVDALDLTVREGELFGLLGVNGAGKTTTIKMLSGLLKPTDGTATVLGHDLETELSAIKPHVGVSPQETAVAPNLSVRENLDLIAGIYGSNRGRVESMLDELGLKKAEKSTSPSTHLQTTPNLAADTKAMRSRASSLPSTAASGSEIPQERSHA